MRVPPILVVLALTAGLAASADADGLLTLEDAIARARSQHPDARSAVAAEREAEARLQQARAGWFPRVDYVEGWQRGDQPVFVFSSLLTQRRFTEGNFLIESLNQPDPVNNFRTAFLVEQALFDGGATRAAVRAARAGRSLAASGRAQAEAALAEAATGAYGRVLLIEAQEAAAAAAVEAAEADAARARDRRDAGLVTDADVLALEVHLAQMREQHITASGEATVARAQLNQVIGAPLDARFSLVLPAAAESTAPDATGLDADALSRPEVQQARLRETIAAAAESAARGAYLPHVTFQGAYEFNGGTFGDRVSGWIVGAQVRVNLFKGLADAGRLMESREAAKRAALSREKAETDARVEVHAARARLDAATARERVGRMAVAQARETQRIVRDRYESGMATVTDVLRAAQATLQAEFQEIGARVDVLVRRAALDRARGRL